MKPFSILVTIILGVASLGVVVWVGQYRASGLLDSKSNKPTPEAPAPTVEDLPLPKSGPYGKAEIEESSFNFGTNYVGAEDKHTFTIKNSGEGLLEIKLGKPTCQCTVGEVTKVDGEVIKQGPFPPGERVLVESKESVNILVKWIMKHEVESFRQSVPVITTDPDRRTIDLEVTGKVDQPIHLTPGGFWDIGEMSRTEPTKIQGYVFTAVYPEFVLTEVPREKTSAKITFEPASTEFLESKSAKSGYVITAEISPNIPIGLFREVIQLKAYPPKAAVETAEAPKIDVEKPDADKPDAAGADAAKEEDTKHLQLEFTLAGHRPGPIDVRSPVNGGFNPTSNRLIFGVFPAAEGKKMKVSLYVKGMTEELVLTSVEPADARFKIKLTNTGKTLGLTKIYDLEVEIPPGPTGRHNEKDAEIIDLKLNHPEAPDFKLLIDYNAKN